MPTELGERFAIDWRGMPEQMLDQDAPTWYAFIDKYYRQFIGFYYNVRVGGPDMSKIDANEAMKKMWYAVTAKRIDAIGEKLDGIWIIEVSTSPYLRAVGQCLSYKFLWELDPKIKKPAKMVLVCQAIDNDLRQVLSHYGVKIIVVEPLK
jgi:hypothetical protein